MTDINNPQKLSRKDFEDYEFIVEELARMGRMSFPEIKDHHKQHPEDNLYTLHHPKDNHLMLFTREGMKRFWQIGRRGLKSLGPEGFKYDLDNVVTELQKLFQSHDVFVAVIAKISEAFLPSAHYVPCTLVAHTRPPQFQIGPVEFQLSEIFWKNNGDAILADLKHQSQHQSIKEFFTQ